MITVRRADIPFTRDGVEGSYPEILFMFDDDTILRAHDANGRWIVTGGNGWEHVRALVDAGWVRAIDHGPSTYGHTSYRVTDDVAASIGASTRPHVTLTVHDIVYDETIAILYGLGFEHASLPPMPSHLMFGGYFTVIAAADVAEILASELSGHVFEADTVGNLVPATIKGQPVR